MIRAQRYILYFNIFPVPPKNLMDKKEKENDNTY